MSALFSASAALDRYFLETRCKIIEIAANLDRIDRGDETAGAAKVAAGAAKVAAGAPAGRGAREAIRDPRLDQIRDAVQALLQPGPGRTEKCQMIFSLPYDASWSKPQ